MSVYHPHDEKECDEFNEILEEKFTKAKQNKGAIIMETSMQSSECEMERITKIS